MTGTLDGKRISDLARFYRSHLIDNVMAFWDRHSVDREHGGFVHMLDRKGAWMGTDKNVWCQGRMTYMYAAMYRQIEQRQHWLEYAKLGRDFLVKHCYAGEGRWHYKVDRAGTNVVEPRKSFFGDAFALMGLCEYASASESKEDIAIINKTLETMEVNLRKPDFNEFFHFNLDPSLKWHAPHMIMVGLAEMLRPVLGDARIRPVVDYALDQVLYTFAKDEHRVLFEVVNADGGVLQTDGGQTINPGHSLECAWFCLEESLQRNDAKRRDRALQIIDWAYTNGQDKEFGGLFNMTHPTGGKPPGPEVKAYGERWDYKVWWVHSESLYCLALAAVTSKNPETTERFLKLHDYTFKVFPDPEFGEWYEYLTRDGQPVYTDKAKWIKSAFHIPRNLMKLTLLFDRAARGD